MAERQTLLNIQYITDHSCGSYQLGEIDTLSDDAVRKHIRDFGEYGYAELRDFAVRMLVNAEREIQNERRLKAQTQCSDAAYKGVSK